MNSKAETDELLERAEQYLNSIPNRGNCGPHHIVSDLAAALRASAAPSDGMTLPLTLAEYARDLRRNPSGGDDYPFKIMNAVANRIDEILAALTPATEDGTVTQPSANRAGEA